MQRAVVRAVATKPRIIVRQDSDHVTVKNGKHGLWRWMISKDELASQWLKVIEWSGKSDLALYDERARKLGIWAGL